MFNFRLHVGMANLSTADTKLRIEASRYIHTCPQLLFSCLQPVFYLIYHIMGCFCAEETGLFASFMLCCSMIYSFNFYFLRVRTLTQRGGVDV